MQNEEKTKLVIEATDTTPYIEIDYNGSVKIIGELKSEKVKSLYSSLFWGLNKITSRNLFATIQLNSINEASVPYLNKFLDILIHNLSLDNVNVIWIYDQETSGIFQTGQKLKENNPEISFQLLKL